MNIPRVWNHCCRAAVMALVGIAGLPGGPARAQILSQAELQRPPAVDDLNRSMAVLARSPRDVPALIDAGEAALALTDVQAALGFFGRADAASPGNGRVKAGLGRTMLGLGRMSDAARLLDEAGRLGYSDPRMLADRGLIRDLAGDGGGAVRDYLAALKLAPGDEEVTRRYALSLGISGQPDLAEQMLEPLLYKSDRAAWRAHAFILAINGRREESHDVAAKVMPAQMATAMQPYLDRMPLLSPAQRAEAVHLGKFPVGLIDRPVPPLVRVAVAATDRPAARTGRGAKPGRTRTAAADLPRAVSGTAPLGEQRETARAAAPVSAPVPDAPVVASASGAPPPPIDYSRAERYTAADAAAARTAPPAPPALPSSAAGMPAPDSPPRALPATGVARTGLAGRAGPIDPVAPAASEQARALAGMPASTPPAAAAPRTPPGTTTPSPGSSVPAPPAPPPAIATADPVRAQAGAPPSSSAAPASPAAQFSSAGTPLAAPRDLPAGRNAPPAQAAPGSPRLTQADVSPPPAPPPIPGDARSAPAAAERSLADIVATVELPDPVPANTRPVADLDAIKALQEAERKARLAAEARARKEAEARAKREAEVKAKAEAAAERKRIAANPARHWVQVATGRNRDALAFDLRKMRKEYGAILGSGGAGIVASGRTSLLLIGPLSSPAKARDLAAQLTRAGNTSLTYNSEAGEEVTLIGGK